MNFKIIIYFSIKNFMYNFKYFINDSIGNFNNYYSVFHFENIIKICVWGEIIKELKDEF